MDRRGALKRGGGQRGVSLDESFMGASASLEADETYERSVFRAKVEAAVRKVESESEFMSFQVYRMRVFDGMSGKDVSGQLGISEPTVSRHLAKVRQSLRRRLAETVATFSFTDEEAREAEEAGLYQDDELFDAALSEIYHQQLQSPTNRTTDRF